MTARYEVPLTCLDIYIYIYIIYWIIVLNIDEAEYHMKFEKASIWQELLDMFQHNLGKKKLKWETKIRKKSLIISKYED